MLEQGSHQPEAKPASRKADPYRELVDMLSIAPRYPNLTPYPKEEQTPKWVIRKGLPWPTSQFADGEYPYVVCPDGELRVAAQPRPEFKTYHAALVKGREVIASGILGIRAREVFYISNESGHYCPEPDSVAYALSAMRFWRVPLAASLIIDTDWSCIGGQIVRKSTGQPA